MKGKLRKPFFLVYHLQKLNEKKGKENDKWFLFWYFVIQKHIQFMQPEKQKKSKKKVILYSVGILLLLVIIGQFAPKEGSKKENVIENKKSAEKETLAKDGLKDFIEGMTPAAIYEQLKTKGFTIDKDFGNGSGLTVYCEKQEGLDEIIVRISSEGASEMVEVVTTYTNMSTSPTNTSELARSILLFIASMPYENSKPEEAKKWVEEHLDKNGETTIGGIKFTFTVSENKRARVLRISSHRADVIE